MKHCPACGVDNKTHKRLDCTSALRKELKSVADDAKRYHYIRDNMEWHRNGALADEGSHVFIGCKFPYLANFECAAMLDYNIDKMLDADT